MTFENDLTEEAAECLRVGLALHTCHISFYVASKSPTNLGVRGLLYLIYVVLQRELGCVDLCRLSIGRLGLLLLAILFRWASTYDRKPLPACPSHVPTLPPLSGAAEEGKMRAGEIVENCLCLGSSTCHKKTMR